MTPEQFDEYYCLIRQYHQFDVIYNMLLKVVPYSFGGLSQGEIGELLIKAEAARNAALQTMNDFKMKHTK